MKMTTAIAGLLMVLAGCLGGPAKDANDAEKDPAGPAGFVPQEWSWKGEFLAGGIDQPHRFEFEVTEGATEVEGVLTWTIPGAILDFALFDPTGEEAANGWGESDSHRYVTTTKPVIAGMWSAQVIIERGVDAHYDFAVKARVGEPFGPIPVSYQVPPNDFAEINFNMVPGDHFNFTWRASSEIYFNVHYHADGTTKRPFEYTGTALDSNFTAPANEVYSMLWRNSGLLPVTVTASVEGNYRLHSMTRDNPN